MSAHISQKLQTLLVSVLIASGRGSVLLCGECIHYLYPVSWMILCFRIMIRHRCVLSGAMSDAYDCLVWVVSSAVQLLNCQLLLLRPKADNHYSTVALVPPMSTMYVWRGIT